MANNSKIEWTDATWNPVTGCTKVSRGCTNCYAETWAQRHLGEFSKDPARKFTDIILHRDKLDLPLHWRKPRRIFVNSMSDLFHESVSDEFIAAVFGVMYRADHHIFQILTKRPERMLSFLHRCGDKQQTGWITHDSSPPRKAYDGTGIIVGSTACWPLPNVWLGVSVENSDYTFRIDYLRRIKANIKFISFEPLIGPVTNLNLKGINWVIVGGESGPHARPMHPDWVRNIRIQCQALGIPFFFKQYGEWTTEYPQNLSMAHRLMTYEHEATFYRVGKNNAGRLLDGRTWDEMPS